MRANGWWPDDELDELRERRDVILRYHSGQSVPAYPDCGGLDTTVRNASMLRRVPAPSPLVELAPGPTVGPWSRLTSTDKSLCKRLSSKRSRLSTANLTSWAVAVI